MNNRFMSRFMGTACFMSAEGNVAGADAAEKETALAELKERFNKKDKLVALPDDDQEAFADVVSSFADGVVKDWTNDVDASLFTGMALAKAENGRVVLIPVASMEAAFNDPTVRAALYRYYVNRVVNEATSDDAQASQFITVAGCFKQKFDLDAFKFLAKAFVKKLREQGLRGITINGLRQAFASQAFAATQFPRTTKEQWQRILDMAEAFAKHSNKDTSIYEHFKATRDVQEADSSPLKLDFSGFGFSDETADETVEEEAPKQ